MDDPSFIFREVDRQGFEDLQSGLKAIETRAAKPKYEDLKEGNDITFTCGKDTFVKRIVKIYHWPSIDAMVADIPFKKVMPRVGSIEEMKAAYATYPNYEQDLPRFGLIAFELE